MLNPIEHHRKHHRLWDGSLPRYKSCQKCVIARAKCAGKRVFKNRELADKSAIKYNIEQQWWPGECMKAYRCRYCKAWHLSTARSKIDRERVEKMRRKYLRRTHQKDRGWDHGWRFNQEAS